MLMQRVINNRVQIQILSKSKIIFGRSGWSKNVL